MVSVTFGYDPLEPVLRDIDVDVTPGEVVGIVGPSGSGKSTLAQLLLGLREPTKGKVLADGREIASLAADEWARKVAAVPQRSQIIVGTIADNIRFMREGITDDDLLRAAKQAHLHDDIVAHTEGYDRRIGDGGSQLSGGQAQRLALARALAGSPEVLVLDEPTSALDAQSETLVRKTLEEIRGRTSIVIIAHRLTTLDICDRIIVLQDGRLVGFDSPARVGTLERLLSQLAAALRPPLNSASAAPISVALFTISLSTRSAAMDGSPADVVADERGLVGRGKVSDTNATGNAEMNRPRPLQYGPHAPNFCWRGTSAGPPAPPWSDRHPGLQRSTRHSPAWTITGREASDHGRGRAAA